MSGMTLFVGLALGSITTPHISLPITFALLSIPFAVWVAVLLLFFDDSGVCVSLGDIDCFWGPVYRLILRRRVIAYHKYLTRLKFRLPDKTPIVSCHDRCGANAALLRQPKERCPAVSRAGTPGGEEMPD